MIPFPTDIKIANKNVPNNVVLSFAAIAITEMVNVRLPTIPTK